MVILVKNRSKWSKMVILGFWGGIKNGKRVKKVKNGHFGVLGSILGLRGVDFGSFWADFGALGGKKRELRISFMCVFKKMGSKNGGLY